jgi:hypothetical protein
MLLSKKYYCIGFIIFLSNNYHSINISLLEKNDIKLSEFRLKKSKNNKRKIDNNR